MHGPHSRIFEWSRTAGRNANTLPPVGERAKSTSRTRALTAVPRVRAPIRLTAVAVLVLAGVSVVSFPSPGAAGPSDPPELRVAVLTPDFTDSLSFDAAPDRIQAIAAASNSHTNMRSVFWWSDAPVETDATSCATWTDEAGTLTQPGAALHLTEGPRGSVQAITVTKNIYFGGPWIFNIHVWDSDTGRMDRLDSVPVRSLLVDNDEARVRPLPWRLCARTRGSELSFKVWPTASAEPPWDDSRFGGTIALPADAPASGASGWYIGHMSPGTVSTFSDLTTTA